MDQVNMANDGPTNDNIEMLRRAAGPNDAHEFVQMLKGKCLKARFETEFMDNKAPRFPTGKLVIEMPMGIPLSLCEPVKRGMSNYTHIGNPPLMILLTTYLNRTISRFELARINAMLIQYERDRVAEDRNTLWQCIQKELIQ